jgi:ribosomal protein S27AE
VREVKVGIVIILAQACENCGDPEMLAREEKNST